METRPEKIEDGDYVELLDLGYIDAYSNEKPRYCSRIYRAYGVRDNWWAGLPNYRPCNLRPLVKRYATERDEIPFAAAKLRKLDALEVFARMVQMGLNNPEQS